MTNAVAPLTPFPLGAPAENGEAQALRYRLGKSFAVVHFEVAGKGRIVFLPEGAELRMVGSSRLSECFEVVHQGQPYHIFKADLLGPWAIRLKKRAIRPSPARPVGVCA